MDTETSDLGDRLIENLERLVISEGRHRGENMVVLPWQQEACHGIADKTFSALSVARGNGKTAVAGGIAVAALDPDGALFRERGEIVLCASSLGQTRVAFRHIKYFMADKLERDRRDWRILDSTHHREIEHKPSGTLLKCIGSDAKRAHGMAPSLIIADEPAKWVGGGRELFVALRTSLGKQEDGKFVGIGTRPNTPDHWFSEMLKGGRRVHSQLYCAEKGDPDFELETILKANPSWDHLPDLQTELLDEAEEAKVGGHFLAEFRALRLNMGTPETADAVMLVSLDNWQAVVADIPRAREGPVFVGIDIGGGNAMSAVAFYWPVSGLLETFAGFPAEPNLDERGKRDAVGNRYVSMLKRGELKTYPGLAMNNAKFLKDAFEMIEGEKIEGIGADRYKQKDLQQVLLDIGRDPDKDIEWRAVGRGPSGSEDVKAFQADVLEPHLNCAPSLALESAIEEAVLHHDTNGNPSLDKRRHKGRIDVIQAAVIAVGMGRRWRFPAKKKKDADAYAEMFG